MNKQHRQTSTPPKADHPGGPTVTPFWSLEDPLGTFKQCVFVVLSSGQRFRLACFQRCVCLRPEHKIQQLMSGANQGGICQSANTHHTNKLF